MLCTWNLYNIVHQLWHNNEKSYFHWHLGILSLEEKCASFSTKQCASFSIISTAPRFPARGGQNLWRMWESSRRFVLDKSFMSKWAGGSSLLPRSPPLPGSNLLACVLQFCLESCGNEVERTGLRSKVETLQVHFLHVHMTIPPLVLNGPFSANLDQKPVFSEPLWFFLRYAAASDREGAPRMPRKEILSSNPRWKVL